MATSFTDKINAAVIQDLERQPTTVFIGMPDQNTTPQPTVSFLYITLQI
jgi:hypothetical protein